MRTIPERTNEGKPLYGKIDASGGSNKNVATATTVAMDYARAVWESIPGFWRPGSRVDALYIPLKGWWTFLWGVEFVHAGTVECQFWSILMDQAGSEIFAEQHRPCSTTNILGYSSDMTFMDADSWVTAKYWHNSGSTFPLTASTRTFIEAKYRGKG